MPAKYTMHFCKFPHPATMLARKKPISRTLYEVALDASFSDGQADYAICVYQKGRIVAVFMFDINLFDMHRHYKKGNKILYTNGTAVIPSLQGRGIASKMWQMAINKFKPDIIDTYVVSSEGLALAKKMKKLNSKVKFRIERAIDLDW